MVTPLKLGDRASRTKKITDDDVRAFATISGDTNSVHLDDEAAAHSIFGQRIAHGMLTASLISAVLGNDLPGPGTIYLKQEVNFKKPVFLDDEITAVVEVVAYREDKRIATLRTTCSNQREEVVIEGQAVVIAPASV